MLGQTVRGNTMSAKSDLTAADLPFGIKFVEAENVPAPPRKNDRNDELWAIVKDVLNVNRGQFAHVKTFDNTVAAGAKASAINSDKNKIFPAADFEARYSRDKEKNTSSLFLMRKDNGS